VPLWPASHFMVNSPLPNSERGVYSWFVAFICTVLHVSVDQGSVHDVSILTLGDISRAPRTLRSRAD